MKDTRIRKNICIVMLMVNDGIKLLIRCLIATISISICMENGWIISGYAANISYDMFWKIYAACFVLVPLIMLYRGFTGRYRVEVKICKSEPSLGIAKRVSRAEIDKEE